MGTLLLEISHELSPQAIDLLFADSALEAELLRQDVLL
jgi:hypothetical protein